MSEPTDSDDLAVIEAKLDRLIDLLSEIRDAANSAVGLIALLE